MTEKEIQIAVDAWLEANLADFEAKQEAFLASKGGRYFQGIITPAVPPKDGSTKEPVLTRKPTDQAEDWGAFGKALSTLPCSVEIHVYEGPKGKGWTLHLHALTDKDERLTRSIGFGPEAEDNAKDWTNEGEIVSASAGKG